MQNNSSLKTLLGELNIDLAKMENEAAGMSNYPQSQKVFYDGINKTREVIKQVQAVLLTGVTPGQNQYPQIMPMVLPPQYPQAPFLPPQPPAQEPQHTRAEVYAVF